VLVQRRKSSLEQPKQTAETNVVKIDSLMRPLAIQTKVEVPLKEKTELWTVKDFVVQFLETLYLAERPYQVSVLEECAQEESAPKMAHLRVVPVLVNGVTEEEALLDSGS